MAFEQPGFQYTLVAGADLSAKQFLFMKLDSNGNAVVCAAATDKPIGILQNDPAAVGTTGQEADIMANGISKVIAGGSVSIDDLIGTDANGKAVTYVPGTDTTKFIVGRALTAAASGEMLSVLFNCMSLARGA